MLLITFPVMATLRKKCKLAVPKKENCQERPRSNLAQNSNVPKSQEDHITDVSEEFEGRVTPETRRPGIRLAQNRERVGTTPSAILILKWASLRVRTHEVLAQTMTATLASLLYYWMTSPGTDRNFNFVEGSFFFRKPDFYQLSTVWHVHA